MTNAAADWQAARYHQVAQPHAAWGATVLDRLPLRGDELVLDAGCGSGRVTAQLLERLPRGRVIAADLSPAMLAEARRVLEPFASRVRFLQTDLLEVDQAVSDLDVVFSTATFHWIEDHQRLYAALHRVLKSGGRLVAQYGGAGNLAEFMRATDAVVSRAPFAAFIQGQSLWRFYATPEQTRAYLAAAGFGQVEAWLEPSPQRFETQPALADFARAVVLRNHLAALPSTLHDACLRAVTDEIARRQGGYVLDYVRLNVEATA